MCLNQCTQQKAPGLPADWKFIFGATKKKEAPVLVGLGVATHNGKVCHSIKSVSKERAFPLGFRHDACVFDNAVVNANLASSSNAEPREKLTDLSAKKEVGRRVYAKFANGQYYWGQIKRVTGWGACQIYDIAFDDGDFLAGVLNSHTYTEKQYVSNHTVASQER